MEVEDTGNPEKRSRLMLGWKRQAPFPLDSTDQCPQQVF